MDTQATQLGQQQAMAQAVNSNTGAVSSRKHPSHVAAFWQIKMHIPMAMIVNSKPINNKKTQSKDIPLYLSSVLHQH